MRVAIHIKEFLISRGIEHIIRERYPYASVEPGKDLHKLISPGGPNTEIIILDPSPVQDEIEQLEDQLEVKRNSLRKNELNARSIRVDLDYNIEVKKLKIASLKSEIADQEQLLEVGGISPARFFIASIGTDNV